MESYLSLLNKTVDLASDTSLATKGAVEAFKAVSSLFQGSKAGADVTIEPAMSELQMEVAKAHAANADLVMALTSLRLTLSELRNAQADFDRYELWKSPTGAIVYRLKEAEAAGEPQHFLCPNCIQDKRKSILQGKPHHQVCHSCLAHFELAQAPPISTR